MLAPNSFRNRRSCTSCQTPCDIADRSA
jgi:hypothetical protein